MIHSVTYSELLVAIKPFLFWKIKGRFCIDEIGKGVCYEY